MSGLEPLTSSVPLLSPFSHTCGLGEAQKGGVGGSGGFARQHTQTQSALIYFLHLLWFLQQHSWGQERSFFAHVCVWKQLCQHSEGLSAVRRVSVAKNSANIPPSASPIASCITTDMYLAIRLAAVCLRVAIEALC